MKSKVLIKINIALWTIIAMISTLIFVLFAIGGFPMNSFNSGSIFHFDTFNFIDVKTTTVEESISDIHVDWIAGSVEILKSPTSEISVVQKAPPSFDENRMMQVTVNNGTLHIVDKNRNRFAAFMSPHRFTALELYLPEKLYNTIQLNGSAVSMTLSELECTNLDVHTVSGKIQVGGVFTNAILDSTSGSIEGSVVADNLSVKSVSGSIHLSGEVSGVILSTTSGSIKTYNFTAKTLYAKSNSGSVRAEDSFEEVELKGTRGSLHLDSRTMLTKLISDSVSGSTHISLPDNEGFLVSVRTTSGSFNSDFPTMQSGKTYSYKSGGPLFSIHTTSGNVKVLKN